MKPRYSEVFENYAEIAREEGLISEANEKTNARHGSDDISTIEALYGIKPNGDEDILDQAHPESVIIAPAYDRLNGLVENLKERQNIMVGIVMKPHQAKVTQHRYAQEELFNELISLGFKMDNANQDNLATLADSCASRVHASRLEKSAGWFLPILAGVGVVMGTIAVVNNWGAKVDQGVVKNCDRAAKLLADIAQDSDHSNLASTIPTWLRYINYVHSLGMKASATPPVDATMDTVHDLVGDPKIKEINDMLSKYAYACEELAKRIPSWITELQHATSTGGEADSDWWAALKSVYHKFAPENVAIAVTALQTLQESLLKSRGAIEKQREAGNQYVQQNQEDFIAKVENKMKDEQGKPAAPKIKPNAPPEFDEISKATPKPVTV